MNNTLNTTNNTAPTSSPATKTGNSFNNTNQGMNRGGSRGGQQGGRGRGGAGGRPGGRGGAPKDDSGLNSKAIDIARVTRVTGGGKRFSFRTTMIAGDGKGLVGVGVAQGVDVAQSMNKATNDAKKKMVKVSLVEGSIAHAITAKYKSAVVMLKPAPKGHGVKAGGPVRVVARLAGVENLTAKLLSRTTNKINIARATIKALSMLHKAK